MGLFSTSQVGFYPGQEKYYMDVFTANGTWNCCTGATCIEVMTIAGGGGGGGGAGTDCSGINNKVSGGAGGGGGGVSICLLTTGFGTSQCVIVGQGGAGGARSCFPLGAVGQAGNGSNGGDSCFGSLVKSTGGKLGPGGCVDYLDFNVSGGAGGTGNQGTSGRGGNVCLSGGNGIGQTSTDKPGGGGVGWSCTPSGAGFIYPGTKGGNGFNIFGGERAGQGRTGGDRGTTATVGFNYGGGGAGGGGNRCDSVNAGCGGVGGNGIVVVYQYLT